MASSVADLTALVPNWYSGGLTWDDFGACTQTDIDGLKTLWFPNDVVNQIKLQGIWTRHHDRQQGKINSLISCDWSIISLKLILFCVSVLPIPTQSSEQEAAGSLLVWVHGRAFAIIVVAILVVTIVLSTRAAEEAELNDNFFTTNNILSQKRLRTLINSQLCKIYKIVELSNKCCVEMPTNFSKATAGN